MEKTIDLERLHVEIQTLTHLKTGGFDIQSTFAGFEVLVEIRRKPFWVLQIESLENDGGNSRLG